ncbi:MAG: 3-dehydroquinate synthase [Legionellales bacterium]|jgi:3-dehydroquinate synthase
MQLQINTQHKYVIDFIPNLLNNMALPDYCKKLASKIVIITDDNVNALYGEKIKNLLAQTGLPVFLLSFPAGENHKTRETKALIEDQMLAQQCMRDTCIIALGGGIVTDVAGFVAATYCRGIPVIYIPTTLLAMVDASIGGKTGINTPHGKNLIGTFTQPIRVYIDVDFLLTLPKEEFNNGVVELIKHAIIADKKLFEELAANPLSIHNKQYLQDMIYRSCDIKRKIVEQDPEEKNMRKLLNFGHTVGHALEAASNYQIRHGEAVAIGMIIESAISAQLGLLAPQLSDKIAQILCTYNVPLRIPESINLEELMTYFKLDKKNLNNEIYCVLLEDIGKPYVLDKAYAHPIDKDLLSNTIMVS